MNTRTILKIAGGFCVLAGSFWITDSILEYQHFATPVKWELTYTDANGKPVSTTSDKRSGFESAITLPAKLDITFSECGPFNRYRLFIGPHVPESTQRAPSAWNAFTSDGSGQWSPSGGADGQKFTPSKWYSFSMKNPSRCVSQLRMDIRDIEAKAIIRVYDIQLYTAALPLQLIGY